MEGVLSLLTRMLYIVLRHCVKAAFHNVALTCQMAASDHWQATGKLFAGVGDAIERRT
jgi:hypothetical protein